MLHQTASTHRKIKPKRCIMGRPGWLLSFYILDIWKYQTFLYFSLFLLYFSSTYIFFFIFFFCFLIMVVFVFFFYHFFAWEIPEISRVSLNSFLEVDIYVKTIIHQNLDCTPRFSYFVLFIFFFFTWRRPIFRPSIIYGTQIYETKKSSKHHRYFLI